MACEHEDDLLLGADPYERDTPLHEMPSADDYWVLIARSGQCLLKATFVARKKLSAESEILREWNAKKKLIDDGQNEPFDIDRWWTLRAQDEPQTAPSASDEIEQTLVLSENEDMVASKQSNNAQTPHIIDDSDDEPPVTVNHRHVAKKKVQVSNDDLSLRNRPTIPEVVETDDDDLPLALKRRNTERPLSDSDDELPIVFRRRKSKEVPIDSDDDDDEPLSLRKLRKGATDKRQISHDSVTPQETKRARLGPGPESVLKQSTKITVPKPAKTRQEKQSRDLPSSNIKVAVTRPKSKKSTYSISSASDEERGQPRRRSQKVSRDSSVQQSAETSATPEFFVDYTRLLPGVLDTENDPVTLGGKAETTVVKVSKAPQVQSNTKSQTRKTAQPKTSTASTTNIMPPAQVTQANRLSNTTGIAAPAVLHSPAKATPAAATSTVSTARITAPSVPPVKAADAHPTTAVSPAKTANNVASSAFSPAMTTNAVRPAAAVSPAKAVNAAAAASSEPRAATKASALPPAVPTVKISNTVFTAKTPTARPQNAAAALISPSSPASRDMTANVLYSFTAAATTEAAKSKPSLSVITKSITSKTHPKPVSADSSTGDASRQQAKDAQRNPLSAADKKRKRLAEPAKLNDITTQSKKRENSIGSFSSDTDAGAKNPSKGVAEDGSKSPPRKKPNIKRHSSSFPKPAKEGAPDASKLTFIETRRAEALPIEEQLRQELQKDTLEANAASSSNKGPAARRPLGVRRLEGTQSLGELAKKPAQNAKTPVPSSAASVKTVEDRPVMLPPPRSIVDTTEAGLFVEDAQRVKAPVPSPSTTAKAVEDRPGGVMLPPPRPMVDTTETSLFVEDIQAHATPTRPRSARPVVPNVYARRTPAPEVHRSLSPDERTTVVAPLGPRKERAVCPAWQGGRCEKLAKECDLLHPDQPLPPPPPLPPTRLYPSMITCWFWQRQKCKIGSACMYAHHDTGHYTEAFPGAPDFKTRRNRNAESMDASTVARIDLTSVAVPPPAGGKTTVQTVAANPQAYAPRTADLLQQLEVAQQRPTDNAVQDNARSRRSVSAMLDQVHPLLAKLFPIVGPTIALDRNSISAGCLVTDEIRLNFFSQAELDLARDCCGPWTVHSLSTSVSAADYVRSNTDKIKRSSRCPMGYLSGHPNGWQGFFLQNGEKAVFRVVQFELFELVIFPGTRDGYIAMGLGRLMKWDEEKVGLPLLFRILPREAGGALSRIPQSDTVAYEHSAGLMTIDASAIVGIRREGGPKYANVVLWTNALNSPEAAALERLFRGIRCKPTICVDATTYNASSTPGAVFIITSGLRFYNIPGFRTHLDCATVTYDLHGSAIWDDRPLQRLCPPNIKAVLVTNDIFVDNPELASRILHTMHTRVQEARSFHGSLVTRPFMRAWLAQLAKSGETLSNTRWLKLYEAYRELCPDDNMAEDTDPGNRKSWITHCHTGGRIIGEAKDHDGQWSKDPVRCTDRMVDDFVSWSYRNAMRFGHFTVVHEAKREPGVTDPREWMAKYHHLNVLTPRQWLEKMAVKK